MGAQRGGGPNPEKVAARRVGARRVGERRVGAGRVRARRVGARRVRARRVGGPKGGGPEGWGPEGWGPKFALFFSPLPPHKSFFSSLSGGLLVVVFEAPGRSSVHVWSSLVVV